ncbi:hypothetical protein QVO10_12745 [Bacteroides gallinaceum]|uniref:Lipoprotein n=4 Tax=Bacteroidales TaxID=171549 RepID=F0R585_PHOSB|nr:MULTISPECIES: hypothetical protein [Bacteroides]ADY37839.1 hypothetical protein Bacsa_3313 [Phocaeicola salanitronis DSM 18170]MBD8041689.1 hypothetical protein [Phocaeicola intestinalis]OUO49157.1 hypothetical protein B5F78_15720 [Bacteroides sp. An279]OUP30899.1 hypothetical protein B5F25_13030 [Bacteroides sp. An19]CCZ68801.1 putative uncharacterized protein [Bacteroides sp. CAG:702]HJD10618.1 hypothetical protein [Candidatus Phocaeicola caecigallinarum]
MKNILRKLPTFIGVCILMILTSCTTSKSVVSQGVNLSKYKYVAVIDDDTYRMPPELVQYQIQLYDAVEQSGLTLINQYRINELTQSEQSALLLATFGVAVSQEETVITVNFIDFNTDRPLVSCRGAYTTLGISHDADIKGALKRVGEQISKTFK